MSLNQQQIEQLLRPINPKRVLHAQGMSHVSQQDVRAHLIRVFGFDGWDKEILDLRCVRDEAVTIPGKNGGKERHVQAVTYLCRLRLTIRDPQGNVVKVAEDVGTGTSPNLPDYGDAHDFAAKNAVSYALKRCATDLGDQFGLSLYNKGQTSALVGGLVVHPEPNDATRDVEATVPQQVDLGDERPDFDRHEGDPAEVAAMASAAPVPSPSDEKRGQINAAKRRVKTLGEKLGKDLSDLEADFAEQYDGAALRDAGLLQLQTFADGLERMAANGSVPA